MISEEFYEVNNTIIIQAAKREGSQRTFIPLRVKKGDEGVSHGNDLPTS